ncbi:hypothetical protein [Hydrocarboniphaga sp.]|uniref:hypothetical protein n=1 Tax=Hydrocarboniphaga sp. TaxID=2033016 RepID=UPI003D14FC8B
MHPRHFSCDAEIEHIAGRFLDHSLPSEAWTHAAHFAAAFALLRDPARDAPREMPALIRAYNEACGKQNTDSSGYHDTITLASLRAARAWLDASPGVPMFEALNALLASPYGRPDWLLAHWSRDRLFSVEARRGWVEPDLLPLPF